MFASPSSSSSSECDEQKEDPILAAARSATARARRPRQRIIAAAAAAAAAYENENENEVKESKNEGRGDLKKGPGRNVAKPSGGSRYIGKLMITAKQRTEEAEKRRLEQAKKSQVPRFMTKSYEAALSRRDEERRSKIPEINPRAVSAKDAPANAHGAALMFVVEEAATNIRQDKQTKSKADKLDGNELKNNVSSNEQKPKEVDKTEFSRDHNDRATLTDILSTKRAIEQNDAESAKKTKKPRRTRGLRRNDAKAIEAYRQRYFQRLAERQKSNT